eukprot:TRINITY_DN7972_c0_g1_i1.p1 TRINITY_DN7972_c0_g1~~TRINITY_DN7972_c0_g1_i1.p1  ORF type:complete len:951 (+),score=393.50 TRINITY_DN7972_c0_g1_i1:135-2987(+)
MSGVRTGGYIAEYAKTSRATCKGCDRSIGEGTCKIGKETPSEYHDGMDVSWYHLSCCSPFKNGWSPATITKIEDLRHWEMLRWADQVKIMTKLGQPIDSSFEQGNNELWDLKDELANVKAKTLKELVEANGIEVHKKMDAAFVLHLAADGMLSGRIGDCAECKEAGKVYFNGREYVCKGWVSAYTRCEFKGAAGPERFKWDIPAAIKDQHTVLKEWKVPAKHPKKAYVKGAATSGDGAAAAAADKMDVDGKAPAEAEPEEEQEDDSSPEDEVPAGQELYGAKIVFAGSAKDLGGTQDELTELVEAHGGEVVAETEGASFMISSETEVGKKRKTKKVTAALKDLPVFSVDLLNNLANRTEDGIKLRQNEVAVKYIIGGSAIGSKPIFRKYKTARVEAEKKRAEAAEAAEAGEGSEARPNLKRKRRAQPRPGSDILKVDDESGKAGTCEILVTEDDEYGFTPYNVMLNQIQIGTGQNKYYKMQALKNKKSKRWHFFIKWGRIGTDVGHQKIYDKGSEASVIEAFVEKFKEHTGNEWADRDRFVKKGGLYFMVDLDDGNEAADDDDEDAVKDEKIKNLFRSKRQKTEATEEAPDATATAAAAPKLSKEVRDLISLIFDKEMMKQTLASFEVDIKKMPLGKISKKQIKDGYLALSEIQEILQATPVNKARLTDATNKFYTLIPHDFGHLTPPLIDNEETVKKKMSMIEALADIEIANNLMKQTSLTEEEDPVIRNYDSLKTDIKAVPKSSELYQRLETYARNSQDRKYFSNFSFEVEDIFEIEREGERGRFQPWAKNDNRMLLWHGSRLTNWCGILSQGLRIAPPEAPKTGYRFGKGVYLADCVSKSGSYCFTSKQAPTGVLLLVEAALGTMNQLKHDEYMEKAPAGTHSTKALGMNAPNPKEDATILDDVKLPTGPIVSTGLKTSCSHNEYVVYDVSQITGHYLLRVKFNHKY